jgi:hypothetical protein
MAVTWEAPLLPLPPPPPPTSPSSDALFWVASTPYTGEAVLRLVAAGQLVTPCTNDDISGDEQPTWRCLCCASLACHVLWNRWGTLQLSALLFAARGSIHVQTESVPLLWKVGSSYSFRLIQSLTTRKFYTEVYSRILSYSRNTQRLNMAVFWDVASCNFVEMADVSEAFSAPSTGR